MLTLNNLKSPKGATRKNKRIGRGQGSGWGTQAGKGHKGQKARTGGGIPLAFEGGQMPVYRRLPKRGFSNAPFKTEYAIITLDQVAKKFESGVVNREALVNAGLLSGRNKNLPLKVLKKSDDVKLASGLVFEGVEKFSAGAKELLEKNGCTISVEKKDNE